MQVDTEANRCSQELTFKKGFTKQLGCNDLMPGCKLCIHGHKESDTDLLMNQLN